MKRMSIAEQTLKKQIEHCITEIALIDRHIEAFNMQKKTYLEMKKNLEDEEYRLHVARINAKERSS
jgi:hypothetical protein